MNSMKDKGETAFGAVILAAGLSSRMGAFKPLLDVGGMPAAERIIKEAGSAGIGHMIMVTGYRRELLEPLVEREGVTEAYNDRYRDGMFSSVKTGVSEFRRLFKNDAAFFLLPVDCPLVTGDIMKKLMDEYVMRGCGKSFSVPVYEGKKGHPLLIPSYYADEICAHDGRGGLKAVTDRHRDMIIRVPVDDEGCILDMDTPRGYEDIKSFLSAGRKRADLAALADGRRIFFVRHGQTRQHDEKIFLGQYDVPLSSEGRLQAQEAAARLSEEGVQAGRIYCSDLKRAAETAGIIAGLIAGLPETVTVKDLREINLGSWDGRKISDIKREFPEDYRERGRDIFTFKKGNGSENFYDLQYRAVRGLRNILKEDPSEDLIIVSHSGVIRALENNLKGLRVDDPWEKLQRGGVRKIICNKVW